MTYSAPIAQRGATLIVALVFLVVLTIAGITAMQFSTMEERMASNSQFRNEMFQEAQSTIQRNLTRLNVNAAQRASLAQATNADLNSGDGTTAPSNLSTDQLAQLGLPLTAKQAVAAPQAPIQAAGFSVIRSLSPAKNCEDVGSEASSLDKFECLYYELHVKEELPNGAASDQSQGLKFINIKSTN